MSSITIEAEWTLIYECRTYSAMEADMTIAEHEQECDPEGES